MCTIQEGNRGTGRSGRQKADSSGPKTGFSGVEPLGEEEKPQKKQTGKPLHQLSGKMFWYLIEPFILMLM